eukprot:764885-Rhodomonas_salina.1
MLLQTQPRNQPQTSSRIPKHTQTHRAWARRGVNTRNTRTNTTWHTSSQGEQSSCSGGARSRCAK